MEWLKNLSNAIEYIEENLDKEISVDTAASIACCSTYYFQRMFSYVAGISLAEYIRKRRMSQAAFELQRTDRKVIDIALKYGYNSPTSFNRAFQNVHGIAPAAAKNNGITLNSYPPIRFSVAVTGGDAMPYHIEEKCPMRMIGVRMPLVDDIEVNMQNIPGFWKQTLYTEHFKQLCSFHQNEPKGILGVTAYQDPDNIFYYIAVQRIPLFLMEWQNLKSRQQHGLFLKTPDVLKKMCRAYSGVFTLNGFRFRDMNMQGFPILKYIRLLQKRQSAVIRKYGLQ